MNPEKTLYLLTIRGTLAEKSIDRARAVHNETAGSAEGIAAARALGDLSHSVFVPADGTPDEILIVDVWNSIEGLMTFFANPHVQEQSARIFTEKDPVVSVAAPGAYRYSFPAPSGRNDRFVGMLRGPVVSREAALEVLDAISLAGVNEGRKLGLMSHETAFRVLPPDAPKDSPIELVSLETWFDGEGMAKFYSDRSHMAGLEKIFRGAPATSTWKRAPGAWIEW